jgi:hypothetical protein
MVDPDQKREPARRAPSASSAPSEREVVDLEALSAVPAEATVRNVLESAADVIFSDGVSAEFLDQWTFETVQLLESRARSAAAEAAREGAPRARRPVSAGRR